MHGLYIGALMFLGVIALGTTAYYLEKWTLSDAFYMVIITVFSVGACASSFCAMATRNCALVVAA